MREVVVKITNNIDGNDVTSEVMEESVPVWEAMGWTVVQDATPAPSPGVAVPGTPFAQPVNPAVTASVSTPGKSSATPTS